MTSELLAELPVAPARVRVISLDVEDHPGVLERVASQVRRRGFNIRSLTVGPVAPGRSRMTVTVDAGTAEVDQVAKQLEKLVEVVAVRDITDEAIVSRELAIVRVEAGADRAGLVDRVARRGGRVVDAQGGSLIVEVTADSAGVEAFISALQPHRVTELARSGPVAMRRISNP